MGPYFRDVDQPEGGSKSGRDQWWHHSRPWLVWRLFGRVKEGQAKRVGELDEEMVFESRVGEVFILGASSWRVEEITHDRVWVTPAPGEPGKMPFWHGDKPSRQLAFGRRIGRFLRSLAGVDLFSADSLRQLEKDYSLDEHAGRRLVDFVAQQQQDGVVPTDRDIVLEFIDELGDWRVCILSPFGAAIHAPWAIAVRARLFHEFDLDTDVVWSDDGIVFRLPYGANPPDDDLFFPKADEVEDQIVQRLSDLAIFASHFRENAGRALLLPKRKPGGRTPLWSLRRRSAALLAIASRFRDFPIVLETYRECLQDRFDLPGLKEVLAEIERRQLRVHAYESTSPSPFASGLMFQYLAQFIYEGDAPLAERRAHALTVDPVKLRELLGEAALRTLFDQGTIDELNQQLALIQVVVDHPDVLHDLLLSLGP